MNMTTVVHVLHSLKVIAIKLSKLHKIRYLSLLSPSFILWKSVRQLDMGMYFIRSVSQITLFYFSALT